MVPSPNQNNTTLTGDKAAAADPTIFDTDLLQPDEICLHPWMLYTSQTPILDLTGKDIKSLKDIDHAIHTLNLCQKKTMKRYLMAEKKQEESTNSSKSLTESDTSDGTEVNPRFKTLVEEREYNTILGSAIATCIALSHLRAQVNLTVECGPLLQKSNIKKLPKDKAKDKATQTKLKDKKSK